MTPKSKNYFAYIRVSSSKQADNTSLPSQKKLIEEFTQENNLNIIKVFAEVKSASGREKRSEFIKMIRSAKKGEADGLIFSRIDRSVRNPIDRAELWKLHQKGVDIRFIEGDYGESIEGELSQDIQFAMSVYYSKELARKVKQAQRCRLEQGLYPFSAPIGYQNTGMNKIKQPDPLTAPLVKKIFELYSTQQWSEERLANHFAKLGLKSQRGNPINRNNISSLLNNRFYHGLIVVQGQTFQGKHQPLISTSLFNKCQDILNGRFFKNKQRHFYVFRQLLKCSCGKVMRCLYAKRQYYYYYCLDCKSRCVDERKIENQFLDYLNQLSFSEQELALFKKELFEMKSSYFNSSKSQLRALNLQIGQLKDRQSKLLDLKLDGQIEDDQYLSKKNQLVSESDGLERQRVILSKSDRKTFDRLENLGKLLESPSLSYHSSNSEKRRELVQIYSENLLLDNQNGGKLIIDWKKPFDLIYDRRLVTSGGGDGI